MIKVFLALAAAWFAAAPDFALAQDSPGKPVQAPGVSGVWHRLFDGKTLSGWDNWGAGDWQISGRCRLTNRPPCWR